MREQDIVDGGIPPDGTIDMSGFWIG